MSVTIRGKENLGFSKDKIIKDNKWLGKHITQRMFEEIVYVELEYRKIIRYSY